MTGCAVTRFPFAGLAVASRIGVSTFANAAHMALSAGTRFGPYEILSAIGAGGMDI